MLQSDWAALYVEVCTNGVYQCLQATSSDSEVGGNQAKMHLCVLALNRLIASFN